MPSGGKVDEAPGGPDLRWRVDQARLSGPAPWDARIGIAGSIRQQAVPVLC